MRTICLNMIVKNEKERLGKLFESLKNIIDYYVISDTGSFDGTPEFIEAEMKRHGIEGEIYHDPWVNFGRNRQKALEHAVGKAKYIFIIDADEVLKVNNLDFFNHMTADQYMIHRIKDGWTYYLPGLIKLGNNEKKFQWEGAVHNYLVWDSEQTQVIEKTDEIWIDVGVGGAKSHGLSDREKYLRDAKMLEEELRHEPNHPRNQFYLAQSYRDAKEYEKAIVEYRKRVEMDGWYEEKYYAQFMVGRLMIVLDRDFYEYLPELLKAHEMFPCRIEPLYYLALQCQKRSWWNQGYMFAKHAISQTWDPKAILFIEDSIYQYGIYDVLALCAYRTGRFEKSLQLYTKILFEKKIPETEVPRIKTNLEWAMRNVKAKQPAEKMNRKKYNRKRWGKKK